MDNELIQFKDCVLEHLTGVASSTAYPPTHVAQMALSSSAASVPVASVRQLTGITAKRYVTMAIANDYTHATVLM